MIRSLEPNDIPRANELFAIAFEQPMKEPPEPDDSRTHRWAAFDDDTGGMMSTLTVTDFTVQFDGRPCKMGGVGGVATLPQYRRRGGIRGCFEALLPELQRGGYAFSYLYPFSTGYYRKFGYECCVRKLHATVDLSLLSPPPAGGRLELAERDNSLTEAIRAIDAAWEGRYNMMVLHQPEDYGWTLEQQPAAGRKYTYVYFGANGAPKAYTTFAVADRDGRRDLACRRFFFADKEGFAGLMGLFKGFASDHRFVTFTLPADLSLAYLMPEWSLGAVAWEVHNAGMVRAVDAQLVLRQAAYRGEGSAVLQLDDPLIPQNNGRFLVRFAAGRAVTVERTDQAPDARLSIAAFSALICGVCAFEDAAAWMSGVEVCRMQPALAQIFYPKPLLIADYF